MAAQTTVQSQQPAEQERLALVGRMASGVVHDVKNIMTVIRCNAELAEVKPAQASRYLDRIVASTDHLLSMVEDLLAFARGERQPDLNEVELADYLRDVLDNHAAVLSAAGITAVLEVEETQAQLDPSQVRRAVQNLIANAVDAMPAGGVLTLRGRRHGHDVLIEVEDTGCGVAPEHLPHLFEPFFTHGKANGTGLGAAVVQSVAEAHAGRVEARSTLGQGTTVALTLGQPVAVTAAQLAFAPAAPPSTASRRHATPQLAARQRTAPLAAALRRAASRRAERQQLPLPTRRPAVPRRPRRPTSCQALRLACHKDALAVRPGDVGATQAAMLPSKVHRRERCETHCVATARPALLAA